MTRLKLLSISLLAFSLLQCKKKEVDDCKSDHDPHYSSSMLRACSDDAYDPQCGCDGHTYMNPCEAAVYVKQTVSGECKSTQRSDTLIFLGYSKFKTTKGGVLTFEYTKELVDGIAWYREADTARVGKIYYVTYIAAGPYFKYAEKISK